MPEVTVVSLYGDGGVILSNPSPYGGTYAWCAVDADNHRSSGGSGVLLPGSDPRGVTNNQTEFYAILAALEWAARSHPGWSGRVHSDSYITLGRLFPAFIGRAEGYRMTSIPQEWSRRMTAARDRLGTLEPIHLSGHPTRAHLAAGVGRGGRGVSEHHVYCDRECTRLARAWRTG